MAAYHVPFESMDWVAFKIVDKHTGASRNDNLLAVCSASKLLDL